METRKENIDNSEGVINPINAIVQGETYEKIKDFIRLRRGQLIKKVSYKFKVEYFEEGGGD